MKTFFQALIPALWLVWLAFWVLAARKAKENARQEGTGSRLLHAAPLIAAGALLASPHMLGTRMEGRFHAHTFGWFLVGLGLVVLGLGFSAAARMWLGRNWSGRVTLKKDHELIQSGPYALVRHPIYTGLLLALAGTVVAIDRWRALVALPLLIAGIVYKIGVEERFMRAKFGDAYERYRGRVKALVPFVV
ncbi:MAG TPA: isoprenylcysteine carboxylmethyltransferase family protein [Pseudolabrys sp.]|uniref:methyltransferase family protein n=1 Tax=Pseudolabrys sp. TaxID=1960880 RepID=UPI002DDD5CF5|nr:isoprenylcysteine carboxylmethyltransferase family protein [Pseudolabrys sp.]HEV2627555.1 isoprenylcysteine carboxylmethyltransferase family protein [Pseudolabrys sp.]